MSSASQFVGNIPEFYDKELGPNIFEDYAADLTRRAVAIKPKRVLELAAGTGIVTRRLREALLKEIPLVATDLNGPMLDVARTKLQSADGVKFQTADAMALPLLEAYDAHPGRWSLSSLRALSWGGAALSEKLQQAFAVARQHGFKVIFRAAYGFTNQDYRVDPKDLDRIVGHIRQIGVVLTEKDT